MSVKVGFKKSDGRLIHRIICLFSPRLAHCEIIVDGVGYPVTGGLPDEQNERIRNYVHSTEEWILIAVKWDKDTALNYLHDNWHVEYDYDGLRSFVLPFFKPNYEKMTCVCDVVRCGIACGDFRLIALPAWRITPYKLWRIMRKKRKRR